MKLITRWWALGWFAVITVGLVTAQPWKAGRGDTVIAWFALSMAGFCVAVTQAIRSIWRELEEVRSRLWPTGVEPFACPRCRAVSWHPRDLEEGYCGRCHDWTATKIISGRPAGSPGQPPAHRGHDTPEGTHECETGATGE